MPSLKTRPGDGSQRRSSGILVRWSPTTIQIVSLVDGTSGIVTERLPSSLHEFAETHQLDPGKVVFSVPSDVAYLVALERSEIVGDVNHQSVKFALEGMLPIDAEAMEIDYRLSDDRMSAVAVEADEIAPVIDELEEAGFQVQYIVAEAIFLAQSQVANQQVPESGHLVWRPSLAASQRHEVITLNDGVPLVWSRTGLDEEDLQRELSIHMESLDLADLVVRQFQDDWDTPANLTSAASDLIDGRLPLAMDLRRGRLAVHDPVRVFRGSLKVFAGALGMFLVMLFAALWWKAMQYESAASKAEEAMRIAFKAAVPGQRVPTAIVKRMKSEHRKMLGQRSGRNLAEQPSDALVVLAAVLKAVPEQSRFEVQTLRINDGSLLLDVISDNYEEGAALAKQLENAGFAVEPPSSSRNSRGIVETRVSGKWNPQRVATP